MDIDDYIPSHTTILDPQDPRASRYVNHELLGAVKQAVSQGLPDDSLDGVYSHGPCTYLWAMGDHEVTTQIYSLDGAPLMIAYLDADDEVYAHTEVPGFELSGNVQADTKHLISTVVSATHRKLRSLQLTGLPREWMAMA